MPTTRSKTQQTHLEEFADSKPAAKSSTSKSTKAPKRKPIIATDEKSTEKNSKRQRTTKNNAEVPDDTPEPENDEVDEKQTSTKQEDEPADELSNTDSVIINRAPVLHLYASCVTQAVHPELEWNTCLSAGAAVSALCAVAKGRSIGVMSEHDDNKEPSRDKKELEHLEVMQFKLKLNKDGLVVVGKDSKKGDEGALKRKFGEEEYEKVREVFENALKSWKGEGDELNKKAFGFYEQFRPNVASGQKGWGRKGELNFDKVRKTITKG